MSQQLGIVVLVDVAAAIQAADLRGSAYFFDNGKWAGSTGQGTGQLVSAVEGTRTTSQLDMQVMNWLPLVIGGPPPSLPRTFFHRAGAGPLADAAPTPLDVLGNEVGADLDEGETRYHPYVTIANITGEAVDRRVLFPAQYGSPALNSAGLYWSASIDTNQIGAFSYTLWITLYYSAQENGTRTERTITLPHEAYLLVTRGVTSSGFCRMPAILPA
jgi:hypothetical protein